MANIELECKATFTVWWYVAKSLKFLGISYPTWLKRKTIAWITAGNKVTQVKLMDEE